MKILHIAYDYDTASASSRLASRQAAEGHEIYFYSKHGLLRFAPDTPPASSFVTKLGPLLFNRLDRALTRLCVKRTGRGFFSAGVLTKPIPRCVRAQDWDRVHIHWIASGFCSLRSALGELRGEKLVHLHDYLLLLGLVPHAYASRSLNSLGRAVQKFLSRRNCELVRKFSPLVVAPSSMAADFATKLLAGTGVRAVVCPNLLGEGFKTARRAPSAGEEKLLLLHVMSGGDPLAKGFDQIVEALRLLPRAIAQRFTLLQVGADVSSVFSVNGCVVRTTLAIAPAAMPEVYCAADFTLVWSIAETFSQAAAESLVCGTPILTCEALPPARFCTNFPSLIAQFRDAPSLAELLLQAQRQGQVRRDDLYVSEEAVTV